MSRTITTVKKEIRILGLDTCDPLGVIGAVVRGGLFQDGVFFLPQKRDQSSKDVANRILETKYFPELRSIMVHDLTGRLDPARIESRTELPVIEVSREAPIRGIGCKRFHSKRADIWVKTKLHTLIIEKILAITWTTGHLPEPVRVAHVLSRTTRKQAR